MFSTSIVIAGLVLLSFKAHLGLALSVTSPSEGASWNTSDGLKVEWATVSSDPQTFDIQISNQDTNTYSTGFTQVVQKDVKASEGSYTIPSSSVSGLKVGSGFRVNLVSSSTTNSGILAQSQPFNVTSVSSSTSTATTDSNSTTGTQVGSNTTSVSSGNQSTVTSGTSTGTNNTSHSVSSNTTTPNAANNAVKFLRVDQMSIFLSVASLAYAFIV
ncbi:hypothetical protein CROQUDRAFT_669581 [Cronartium quercuum f. sp. fusiforme G11]|uniref:Yeast cell wall synthesis Kre9/Knh1-like N-terminal domain-containing protein n=1 Tax=Cronartium quercuum f. sp. fusiforme G11 TaxID=708437 RepID=A0A9P6NKU9_9BASI|nr:hypothetical protein CROQUDRAFT_669581 [Cronartium quercuum f. sp. fusiforme G11]